MRRNIVFIGLITLFYACIAYSQEGCNHEDLIMSFLQKISSKDYFPALGDFNTYFDSHSEIEAGLQDEYIRNNPKVKLSDDTADRSLTLELLLKNKTVRRLIDLRNNQNCKWIIKNRYAKGSATIIYEIVVEGSKEMVKIQMINWKNKNRCGIVDILDSSDKSILIKSTE